MIILCYLSQQLAASETTHVWEATGIMTIFMHSALLSHPQLPCYLTSPTMSLPLLPHYSCYPTTSLSLLPHCHITPATSLPKYPLPPTTLLPLTTQLPPLLLYTLNLKVALHFSNILPVKLLKIATRMRNIDTHA